MFSKSQIESVREAVALLESANRLIVQAHLPATASGVEEATSGLSCALDVFKQILKNHATTE